MIAGADEAAGMKVFGSVGATVSRSVVSAVAVEVNVRTIVVGVGACVNTIVLNIVVSSTIVVGGKVAVEPGAVNVVVAAALVEPPSTGTTE